MEMKKITTCAIYDYSNNETGELVFWEGYYAPKSLITMELKKGRKTQEAVAKENLEKQRREEAERARQLSITEPLINELEQETGPGRISRYAAAQQAAELDDIARQYAGLRQTAIRSLGSRGLAPDRSGLARTSMNALQQGEAEAGTDAFRTALDRTLQQRMAAIDWRTGQRTEAGQQGLNAGELSSNAALRRSQMGSTFGDVMGGIGAAAGIASDILMPGSGLLRRSIGSNMVKLPVNLPLPAPSRITSLRSLGGIGRY